MTTPRPRSSREAASGSRSNCCATPTASSPPGSDTPGGENDNPTEENNQGHAEAVEIVFDPERISYRDLLEFFFQIHRADLGERLVGSEYRSEIFYTSEEQRQVAEDTIADVDASGHWPGKIVTEISEAGPFWEAEAEEQDYFQRYPDAYTSHFPRRVKLPHRETAAQLSRKRP